MNTDTISITAELQQKINLKTKPIGALGMLEDIALKVGEIQNTLSPKIYNPHIVVFAADHGIAATGLVNPYPQAVTAQMVLNFINGGAAINVFCRQHNIELTVVDCGVNYDFADIDTSKKFINAKVGYCTKNYLDEPAMTEREALFAIEKGKEIVENIFNSGCNTIGFGEMGIANTSSAALIMSAVTGIPVAECGGRGTGVSNEQLKTKIETLKKVATFHQLNSNEADPINILTKIGGFEIAMMAGAYLKAVELKMIIVVDGFIATASLLLAININRNVLGNCIFAHTSGEQGHEKMMDYLKAKPLLQLGMRLGEGTGAALAIPLIQSAVSFLNEMASFESAGVSKKQ
jgi:nicotinate-nucleotide--dimethylbenzimidazole phosphoribosyltransferase